MNHGLNFKNNGAKDDKIRRRDEIIIITFHNPSFLIFFPNIFIINLDSLVIF